MNYVNQKGRLIIDGYREEITDSINANDITIISAGTGTGKSTRTPFFIFQDWFERRRQHTIDNLSICVTQPRVLATKLVAEQVARSFKAKVGDGFVGYETSSEKRTRDGTVINFMTTGVLLRRISQMKHRIPYSHIIIDEVHGRDLITDETLLLLKMFLVKNESWKPKIILLSATITAIKFKAFFNILNRSCGTVEVPSNIRQFPIIQWYIDDLKNGVDGGLMIEGLVNPVEDEMEGSMVENFSKIPYLIIQLDKIDQENSKGAVLIFLPGIAEINTLQTMLETVACHHEPKLPWVILPLHSTLEPEQRNRVLETYLPNRKIILSTNISESSVTIPDIRFVIDFCLYRHLKYDELSTFSTLVLDKTSKYQSIQRSGRCGREEKGYAIRICTRNFFETNLLDENPSEMETFGLAVVFMHLKELNLSPKVSPLELFEYAPTVPEKRNIALAVNLLKECGALTLLMDSGEYDDYDGCTTLIGKIIATLSCDPRLARLVAFGHFMDLFEEAVIMSMALSFGPRSMFAAFSNQRPQKGLAAFMDKIHIGGKLQSDCIANLGAYMVYIDRKESEHLSDLKHYNIKSNVMQNIENLINQAHRSLESRLNIPRTRLPKEIDEFLEDDKSCFLLKMLIGISSYPNIFVRMNNPEKQIENAYRELGGEDPCSSFILKPPASWNRIPDPQNLYKLMEKIKGAEKIKWVDSEKSIVVTLKQMEDGDLGINGVPESMYLNLKLKNLGQKFKLIDSEVSRWSQELKLDGPTNPIGLNFPNHFESSTALKQKPKNIVMDRQSVNLFIIDSNYQTKTTYVVSSLFMSRTEKTKLFVAKESTLLPQYPGVYTFLHLINAPKIQLSVDRKEAIVGLGPEPSTTIPICGPRDSRIVFDIPVSSTDFGLANIIRNQMSKMLEPGSEYYKDRKEGKKFVYYMQKFFEKNRSTCHQRGYARLNWKKEEISDFFQPIHF